MLTLMRFSPIETWAKCWVDLLRAGCIGIHWRSLHTSAIHCVHWESLPSDQSPSVDILVIKPLWSVIIIYVHARFSYSQCPGANCREPNQLCLSSIVRSVIWHRAGHESFFAARCYASAAYVVMRCLCVCVCVCVCVSVTFVHSAKTNKHIFKNFSLSGSHTILVSLYQTA